MKNHFSLLARLISVVVGLFFLTDVGLRFLPLHLISFRAWEVVTQFAPYDAQFEPNRRFSTVTEFGDLVNLANLPRLREYRGGTSFTTDSRGFRNSVGGVLDGIPDGILLGDSFGLGATVADHETLAVQLGRASGCRIYNAAGGLVLETARVVELARELGMKSGFVIDEVLEGAIYLRQELPPDKGFYEHAVTASPAWLRGPLLQLRGRWTVSPLRILVNRAFRRLEDDHVLPNPYGSMVIQRTLQTGDFMLFVPEDIEYSLRRWTVTADRWTQLGAELEKVGLKLAVVLVPRKYTVYQPFLLDEDLVPQDRLVGSLTVVEQRLQGAGIPVLNLANAFRENAAREVQRRRYLYWRDDTHWNARGISVAATEINRRWQGASSGPCRLSP